ncbi:hypothetical protein [Deinococcus petrolearius]|uniref:Lipoprotein n=1 Tax=Deinococcus petrolearius TaxID=1751295 RepID=A0ABW1DPA3_9DEIO
MRNPVIFGLALTVSAVLASCGQSTAPTGQVSPTTSEVDAPHGVASYTAANGWENPHPGVYLKTVRDGKGNVKSESYATTTAEGLAWLSARNEARITAVQKGITSLSIEGDADIRREQVLRFLQGPINMSKLDLPNVPSSSLNALAACYTEATGYALPTGPTPGAKALARVGSGCAPQHLLAYAQATKADGSAPVDRDQYDSAYTTAAKATRLVYVYGARNCWSYYEARAGDSTGGTSNYSCY